MISIDRGSHPLPSGECCQEDLHRLVNGGYGLRWLRGRGTGNGWFSGIDIKVAMNANYTLHL